MHFIDLPRIASLLGVALWTVTALSATQDQESQEPFRVDVNLITLRFTVRDADGNLVNNLQQSDFEVLEAGTGQDVVLFEPPRNRLAKTSRLWLAFLLDVSGSTFATRAEEIVAAQTFLDNITDVTYTGIYGFTDSLLLFQKFTPNRALALRAFREARKHLGRTALYTSLAGLISAMQQQAGPREDKAIIVLSDGLDDAFPRSTATASLARQAGIKVYTVLVPSAAQIYLASAPKDDESTQNPESTDQEQKEKAFADLSIQTGGMHFSGFEAILDFDDTLAQINDDLFGNLYTIGYYSDTWSTPIQSRRIAIQPSNQSLSVAIPFRKLPQQIEAKKNLIATLFTDTAVRPSSIHAEGFREIGAQLDVLSTQREAEMTNLPFRIKINPYSFSQASSRGVNTQLGIIAFLIDSEGSEKVRLREVFRVDVGAKEIRNGRGIIYTNRLLAPPGDYRFQVAVLELATWRLTSFERAVRITASRP